MKRDNKPVPSIGDYLYLYRDIDDKRVYKVFDVQTKAIGCQECIIVNNIPQVNLDGVIVVLK